MYRLILSSLLFFCVTSFGAKAESCSSTKYVEKQCVFDIPAIEDGGQFTATYQKFGLIGGVIAQCSSGTVSFGASICKPVDEDTCLVPETVWGSGEAYCKHSSLPGVLRNGEGKTALSESEMDGRIVYLCEDGKLTQKSSFCSPKINSQSAGNVTAQQAEQVFSVYYQSCDVAEVIGKASGDLDALSSTALSLCREAGFNVLDRITSNEPYPVAPNSTAYYYMELLCSDNTNEATKCQTVEPDTGRTSDFVQTIDCNKASIAGVVNSPNLQSPSNSVVEQALCAGNGYSTLDTLSASTWIDPSEDTSDGTSHYVEAICSGNANLDSMCKSDGISMIAPLNCDSAIIEGMIDGLYKLDETRPPTESEVQKKLCVPNGYTTLKEVTHVLFNAAGYRGFYDVTAICEGNTAPTENCENSCMGRPVLSDSSLPKIQGSDGLYYEDLCVETPQAPSGFCQDCENANISFTDSNTGNSCSLVGQNILTGENKDIGFAASDFNGTVNVSCNSSQFSVISGECYKTCKGGSRAVWKDKNGTNSCGATIPIGDYYQDQTVSLTTDVNNGDSVVRCDDGEWVNEGPSQCLLDCSGSFGWGTGVSANGINKNGICRANLSLLKHTASTTSRISSTVPYTDGETDASCNDGTISTSNSTCELDCRSETGYWGSGRCSATIPDTNNNQTANITSPTPLTGYSGTAAFACGDGDLTLGGSTCYQDCPAQTLSMNSCSYAAQASKHNANAPYTLSNATTEANINNTCSDGIWVRSAGSYCTTGTLEYGSWSGWSNSGGRYNYTTWTPPQSNYFVDQNVNQSRSYSQNQTRTRSVYRVFPPSTRRDFVSNETDPRTITGTENRTVSGTKPLPTYLWERDGYAESEVSETECYGADPTATVNIGDSCSTLGASAVYLYSCQDSDAHCGQDVDSPMCRLRYFMTSYLASCGDGSGVVPPPPPPPAPTQTLAECASVNVVTTNNGIDAYDEATAYYSGCEGSVSVQINVVNTQTRNLEPDGTCGSIRNGDTIGPNLGLPRNYTVNQMYSCGIDVDFIFTRGSETHTISETLWEDSEEACQVDTGSNRC